MAENTSAAQNAAQQAAQNAAQQAAQNAAQNNNTNVNAQQAPQQPAPQQESSSHLGWWVAGGIVLVIGATAVISYRKGKKAGCEEERFRRESDAVAGAISAGLNASERYNNSTSNAERGVNANRR